ncbi:DUF218 domain-containing protein [Salinicoccus kekensis]|uniref:DUF218 domain-containing protein n=1 Tax=Salinicoccus kekensis TaxID=714307 RepID=A0A285U738_9STAP|nr:DUF218 domain-containing protein [Salinicoccus kekensis]
MIAAVSIAESFNHGRSDAPEKADVILMLGGGDGGRMVKAAELYHEGYSEYVVISPALDEYYTQSVQFALDLGIPEGAIIEELVATSTYTNATETMDIMEAHDFQSALVVTSDYHLKRSKLIYDRVNSNHYDDVFDFTYVAALSADGDPWYELSYATNIWFREYVKMWGYRLGLYHFIDIPDDGDAQV